VKTRISAALYRLRKKGGFVSGHRFSDATNGISNMPLQGLDSKFEAVIASPDVIQRDVLIGTGEFPVPFFIPARNQPALSS
jgi:hypothetical protein